MRILVISNVYPPYGVGGYEDRCQQIVARLQARGHEVRVLTSTFGLVRPEKPPATDEIRRRLHFHTSAGQSWMPFLKLFRAERRTHRLVGEEIEDFDPEVVHVWNLGGLSKALVLTLAQSGRPIVYDVADHWISRSLRADAWLQWWNRRSGSQYVRFVRVLLKLSGLAYWIRRRAPFAPWAELRFPHLYFSSEALKAETLAKGWSVGEGTIIHPGIERRNVQCRPANERCTRLLYVGGLREEKDPLTAVLALGKLAEQGDRQFTLDLCGRGEADYLRDLKNNAMQYGVDDRLVFDGSVHQDRAEVYARYDMLLFTSAWAEPFPMVALEAMAAGLPVISTMQGGAAELIRPEENALAFAAGDAEDLALKIRQLAADSKLREKLINAAQAEVRTCYDLEMITDQIETKLSAAITSAAN